MEQFWPIFWSVIGTALTTLVGWLMTLFINWVNSKIKDQKLRTFLIKFTEVLHASVNALTQTTVKELKAHGQFDEEAAKRVKEECVKLIKNQLAPDMIDFIQSNFGDVQEYISTQIESFILQAKQ